MTALPPVNDADDLARLTATERQLLVQRYAAAIVLLTSLPANGHAAQDRLIGVDEVAARLGLSKDWVYENADKKLAACAVRLGGALRFSERKLQKFIDRNAGR